jgi:hypothetical protein
MHHKILGVLGVIFCVSLLAGCNNAVTTMSQKAPDQPIEKMTYMDWGAVLAKVVTPDGYVRWDMIQNNDDGVRDKLFSYVGLVGAVSPANRPDLFPTDDDRRAYWINTYNALSMYWVLRYNYPSSVPSSVLQQFVVGGQPLAPNDILYWLKRNETDPTVYFGLNCCAHSSPPLRNVPYEGVILRAQLDDQGHIYLSDPRAVTRHGDTVTLNRYLYGHIVDFAKEVGRDNPFDWQAYQVHAEQTSPLISALTAEEGGFDWSLNRPPQ